MGIPLFAEVANACDTCRMAARGAATERGEEGEIRMLRRKPE